MKNTRHIPLLVVATLIMSLCLFAHVICVLMRGIAYILATVTAAYLSMFKILDAQTLKAFECVTDYVDSVLMEK